MADCKQEGSIVVYDALGEHVRTVGALVVLLTCVLTGTDTCTQGRVPKVTMLLFVLKQAEWMKDWCQG